MTALYDLEDVHVHYGGQHEAIVRAVDGVTLSIPSNSAVGLIGESGSGKSTISRVLLGLTSPTKGNVKFQSRSLATMTRQEMLDFRRSIGAVFQEPYESLNPRMSVASIVAEALKVQCRDLGRDDRSRRVREVLDLVGLPSRVAAVRPRMLSGGQQQRVGIARALVTRPKILILDEPTSSLDLSTRAQILNLLGDIRRETGIAFLFISHDMDTISYLCETTYVMHHGRLVESGKTEDILLRPQMDYTKRLMEARLSVSALSMQSRRSERHRTVDA